jgi:hypothetical protein
MPDPVPFRGGAFFICAPPEWNLARVVYPVGREDIMILRRWLAVLVVVGFAAVCSAQPGNFRYRWFYASQNLLVDSNVTALQQLMQRAHDAGYNGVVLADYKLQILDQVPQHYFANAAAVVASANQLGLELYPSVFPVGYANGMLAHNPNLIEAMPVQNALFIAGGGGALGSATFAADPAVALNNGGFESVNGNTFTGYAFQDNPGQSTFADTATVHGGARSLRMANIRTVSPQYGMCRIMQQVPVSAWRQYHLSVWLKTSSFDVPGSIRVQVLAPGSLAQLCSYELGAAQTQDWTQYHIVFNSQGNTSAYVYFGVWGGNNGQLWWDDGALEEVGLLNVVRRPGAPLSVVAEAGGTVYQEGVDFAAVTDSRLGVIPFAGNYEVYHTPPQIQLLPGSHIQQGERLRVSFYHAMTTDQGKVAICLSEPQTYALMKEEAERVCQTFSPRGLFMAHDEVRVMNWCQACQSRGQTPGQILAENATKGEIICRRALPRTQTAADVFIWSDMFDPYHNAVASYYLSNGSVAAAAAGLPHDVVVVNWNYDQRAQSLPFFHNRGNRQVLAGYYDGPVANIRTWLNDAAGMGVPIEGVMYTTWVGNYADLEAFATAAWGP